MSGNRHILVLSAFLERACGRPNTLRCVCDRSALELTAGGVGIDPILPAIAPGPGSPGIVALVRHHRSGSPRDANESVASSIVRCHLYNMPGRDLLELPLLQIAAATSSAKTAMALALAWKRRRRRPAATPNATQGTPMPTESKTKLSGE